MLRESVLKKILAVFLIFTLTFANFAFVTKSYATTIFDSVFFNSQYTEDENVVYDAYFQAEKDKSYSVISAVKNSVKLSMNIKVQKAGYLKNAQIAIKEANKNNGINFKVDGNFDEMEYVKGVENNIITLKQINSDSQISLEVPLTYIQEEFILPDKISKDFDVVLTGIYVNDTGQEIEINKTKKLNLTWMDEREVKLASEITKYIPCTVENTQGLILQTLVKVDSKTEKALAVKSEELEIEPPKIEGAELEKVNVIAKSTKGIDGKNLERVNFSKENWKYQNGVLKINIENPVEEKYYSTSGIDEYIITYIYKNVTKTNQKLSSNIKATITTFGKENLKNTVEQKFEYEASEKFGEIVSCEVQNETESISKGYTYLNYNKTENPYEIQYNSKQIIDISYKDIVEEIYIEDTTNNYLNDTGQEYELQDIYYKSISISKENFENILSKEGFIEIQNKDGTTITKFTKDFEPDENGNYIYIFDEYKTNNVKIKISKPTNEGNLILKISKVQNKTLYDKKTFSTFDYISLNSKISTKYKTINELLDIKIIQTKIKLEDTITKADLELSTNTFSTLMPTEVEIKIKLNNHKIESDIYGNSVFEILLPECIEIFEIIDYSMIYGDGINLKSVDVSYNDTGGIIVKATVEGIQTDISPGILTEGTNIVFNSRLTVNKFTPQLEKEIILKYTNSEATNYYEEGQSIKQITYSAPKGVVSINSIMNYDETENILTSIGQGKQIAIINNNSNSIYPKMELTVINNNTNPISNISILGRIPFDSNKDILTGEDLGTTVNTKLNTKIVPDSNNKTNFKIYYSSNGEANNDLNDSTNGWTEEMKLEEIKSYLIIPEDISYEMQVSEIIKFVYEFNIPDNLETNNSLCGIFVTYYKNNSELAETDEISRADTVYLTTQIESEEQNNMKETEVSLEPIEETIDVINIEEAESKSDDYSSQNNEELNNIELENQGNAEKTYKITGCVWLDENSDGIRDEEEELKSSVKVNLVDLTTGIVKETVETNDTGQYEFTDLEKGKYFIIFEYDSKNYSLTSYQKNGNNIQNNSKVISTEKKNNENFLDKAVTDVIEISNSNISNINMGLVELKKFNLELTQTVNKITIQNEDGKLEKEFDNLQLAKTAIPQNKLSSSVAYIEYTLQVQNTGDIEGYAKSIVDYVPKDLIFNSSLNPDWYTGTDGNIYTTKLANEVIKKDETKEIKLILIKQMTEENTGIINNTAQIIEDYNVYGLENTKMKSRK